MRRICWLPDVVRRAGIIALAPAMMTVATAQPLGGDDRTMSIEGLKSTYLACERTALASRMDSGSATYCSVAYEELKRRAFDGDAARLRTWSAGEMRRGDLTG